MSPTSLANHRLSVTSKSRSLLSENAPLHRRFVRALSGGFFPRRKRRFILVIIGVFVWIMYSRYGPSGRTSQLAGRRNRKDIPSGSSSPSKELLNLVPSQLQRNKIILHFEVKTPQTIVVPPVVLPKHHDESRTQIWTESSWIDRGQTVRIDMPLGTRIRFVHEDGRNASIERGKGDDCSEDACKGLREFVIEQDLQLALNQLKRADSSERVIVTLPSFAPSYPDDVTLVTQFSVSRLDRFARSITAWDGPASITIYFTEPEDTQHLSDYLSSMSLELKDRWSRLAITLVKPSYSTSREAVIRRLRYPINELRNLALKLSSSNQLLVIDADFVPSPNMHRILRSRVGTLLSQPSKTPGSPTASRQALAISAFALSPHVTVFPTNLSTLQKMFRSHPSLAYLTDANAGHGPSFPPLLFQRPSFPSHPLSKQVSKEWYYPICFEPQWEPYYVLHRSFYPFYDERFTDQGGDKQSHTSLLNALGFEFKMMKDVWVVHPPKLANDAGIDVWPGKKLERLLSGSTGEMDGKDDARHFNEAAQKDEQRFRYFQDYLPELEANFGMNWRWPRGCEANNLIAGKRVGRASLRTVFGL